MCFQGLLLIGILSCYSFFSSVERVIFSFKTSVGKKFKMYFETFLSVCTLLGVIRGNMKSHYELVSYIVLENWDAVFYSNSNIHLEKLGELIPFWTANQLLAWEVYTSRKKY